MRFKKIIPSACLLILSVLFSLFPAPKLITSALAQTQSCSSINGFCKLTKGLAIKDCEITLTEGNADCIARFGDGYDCCQDSQASDECKDTPNGTSCSAGYCYSGICEVGDGRLGESCGRKNSKCTEGSIGCPNGFHVSIGGRDCSTGMFCCEEDFPDLDPSEKGCCVTDTSKSSKDNCQLNTTEQFCNTNAKVLLIKGEPNCDGEKSKQYCTDPTGGGIGGGTTTMTPGEEQSFSYENPIGAYSITQLIMNFLSYIQTLVGWIAVALIVFGGIRYMSSGGGSGANQAKEIISAAISGFAIAVAGPSLLREIRDLFLSGGGKANLIDNANSVQKILFNFLFFLLSAVGTAAIIALIAGGSIILTAGGNSSKVDKGKEIARYAIIAIAVSGAGVLLVRQVISLLFATSA